MELFYKPLPLLHQLFENAEKLFSDEKAVVFEGQATTYHELNKKASQLSYAILKAAEQEEIIGLSTTRSLEMLIGLLAILKAGKSYLPLDSSFPESRLGQIVTSSKVKVCVALSYEEKVYKNLGLEVVASDVTYDHLPVQAPVDQTPNAAVFYTSGSTGKPKGVCVPHSGLVNFLLWQKEHSKAAPHLRTLQFCHLGFDVSVEEIFVPLITGGTLYLITDNYRLDSGNLLDFIVKNSINRMYLPYVELQYFAEEANRENIYPKSLVEVITGGELLKITPQIATFFNGLKNCPLMNKYGPTEACVWITDLKLEGDATRWPEIPTIGKPFANTEIFILNDKLEMVEDGEVGEICASGICVANGYLNEPELTAKAFIDWKTGDRESLRIYKTGDLGRFLPDGTIEFHGRIDGQVKIRGNRVELGDIEVAISQQEGVQQAVVVVREDVPGEKYLAAYLVNKEREIDIKGLREKLIDLLPDYMIPSYFIQLEDLPKTSSGKIDRRALPKPEAKRPDFGVLYRRPSTEIEKNIARVLSNTFQFDRVGVDDNFFELGGNSLLAQKTISELKHQFKYILPILKLYQYPTVAGMAAYIENQQFPVKHTVGTIRKKKVSEEDDVAVIALSGRFPGANTIGELWEVLLSGKETLKFFTEEELDPSIPLSLRTDPFYIKARGVVDGADHFDPGFFGINPKLAELMDPQQRIFMEIAWEALENAGYFPQNGHSNIGVFAGSNNNTYYLNNVQHHKDRVDLVGDIQVMSANEKDYIASRTAYHLNLKGPAISVYSACSTSLLAIAQAVESLKKGQCDLALAGGASITSPINSGHLYQEGAIFSADGHCSPFDASSTGTLFCDGAGVVLLKNLKKAREDGDTIYGVIKGTGVNNDGGDKGSFTAPSPTGQAGAIRMALDDAQIDPADISYVEAHGTGTPIGDPIEVEGLRMAFGPQERNNYCAIGSIKSNIGHLTAAAGIAGFIKTVLSLHNKQLPPSIGFKKPNPTIDFENSPFYVNDKLRNWESERIRRAGVSSFGIGGTNVHVVLEEYPEKETVSEQARDIQLITWSAKSEKSREQYGHRLFEFIESNPQSSLADIAFTLQKTRASFNHRGFVLAGSMDEFARKLTDKGNGLEVNSLEEKPEEVVFSFPGQGAQYLNMGRDLYEKETVYREAVDDCAEILMGHLGEDIRQIMFTDDLGPVAEEKLRNTKFTQPALFATEYALARLWISWGVEPTVLCGHSIGEFVAVHLAGVLSLEDALKAISMRGLLISQLPKGSMLSVRAGMDQLEEILPSSLSIAAINNRNMTVVSGPDEDIAAFAQKLDQHTIPNRILLTSHAFHSSMMDPIVEEFRRVMASVVLKRPQKPVVSTVTGTWLKDEDAVDAVYWAEHIRKTVRFADALDTISSLEAPLFIEVGPGNVTMTLARQQLSNKKIPMLASMGKGKDLSALENMVKALGQVWLNGLEPDWEAFYANQKRKKLMLPNYAFDKSRYWVEAPALPGARVTTSPSFPSVAPNTTSQKVKETAPEVPSREGIVLGKIQKVLFAVGIEMSDASLSFLELGLDSLSLTQVALTLRKEFNLPITFRQLSESYTTPLELQAYLDKNLPREMFQADEPSFEKASNEVGFDESEKEEVADLLKSIELMNQQLQMLGEQAARIQNQLLKVKEEVKSEEVMKKPTEVPSEISIGQTDEAAKNTASSNYHKNGKTLKTSVSDEQSSQGNPIDYFSVPPVPGARLGRDENGNPAWFVADPDKKGGFLQILD